MIVPGRGPWRKAEKTGLFYADRADSDAGRASSN
jgi:hypothetical protein